MRHSEETKRKISEARKNKKLSAEHRRNISLSLKRKITDSIFDKKIFESAVEKITESGCWIWMGPTWKQSAMAYGKINHRGKALRAHRVSYELWKGKIPEDLLVLHHCDVPDCVNPDHLFLGTHQDNMTDKMNKGRANIPLAKLSEESARAILYADGKQKDIAEKFGVHYTTVHDIKNKRTWKNLK